MPIEEALLPKILLRKSETSPIGPDRPSDSDPDPGPESSPGSCPDPGTDPCPSPCPGPGPPVISLVSGAFCCGSDDWLLLLFSDVVAVVLLFVSLL